MIRRHTMSNLCAAFVFALTMLSAVAVAQETPQDVRRECRKLFEEKRLADLNARIDLYLTRKSRTPAGTFELNVCISGVDMSSVRAPPHLPDWNTYRRALVDHIESHPDDVHMPLVLAMLVRAHGWAYRGTGKIGSVSDENLREFRTRIAQARAILDQHRSLSNVNPEWYALRFLVLREGKDDPADFWRLLDEAAGRFPNYISIYGYAARAMEPRWGGSVRDVERVAEFAAKHATGEGISALARTYNEVGDARVLNRAGFDRAALSQSIDDLIMRYPDAWNYSAYARLACRVGMVSQARKLMTHVGDSPIWSAWGGDGNWAREEFKRCRGFAFGKS
jgi:hypothetical protein